MAAPKGNQFWKARATHGRDKIFKTPEDLWSACCEYFEWVDKNPLKEEKLFAYQGEIVRDTVSKIRAMTISGLCLFLDIGVSTWADYRGDRKDFSVVIAQAEEIIYNQKFQGAAADLLNANIIARDLGLRDKQDLEHTGANGGPIKYSGMSEDELDMRIQSLIKQTTELP